MTETPGNVTHLRKTHPIRKPEIQEPGGLGGLEETGQEDAVKESPGEGGKTPSASAANPGKEKSGDRVRDEGITFCLCYSCFRVSW